MLPPKYVFLCIVGYVDDSRNTDNAWMETVALHYHDSKTNSDGNLSLGNLELRAGDDHKYFSEI